MALGDILDRQRGHLFPWSPVFYGIGIAGYFALRFEPTRSHWTLIALAIAGGLMAGWRAGDRLRPVLTALVLVLAGGCVAGARAHLVAETKLAYRYYGPVEGRIIAIDRSVSDAVRLTLDRVVLKNVPPARTPARVRVSLHGEQGFFTPEPGLTIILTGHLSPPGGAVEPGGFDFRRHAWFQRLGAVGYTRTPVLAYQPAGENAPGLAVYRVRMRISEAVRGALPGRAGAFAAAITTGDRSAIDQPTLAALRASNLAHLLAISGLHMGLLTGFIFGALRLVLAALPYVALYWPTKKIAAVCALIAGAVYLALSGGNVATERAFIMVSVMFGAVLADRRAITLRAVAVAALLVLTLRPEALYGPGFQMSFSATTALVAVYGAFNARKVPSSPKPYLLRMLGGVALSSLVAGLATAPIAAAHFNQVPHYGLIANMVSVPLMGAVIIPLAVLAAMLAPLGLAWVALSLMDWPILWILGVAEMVSGWPGSVSPVIAPGASVLPLMTLGAAWLVLWQGRARAGGVPVMVLALVLWSQADRPALLVSQSGGLLGVMTDAGRALSKPKGDGFAAGIWLENDGDPVAQADAATRSVFEEQGRLRSIRLSGHPVLHATGKAAAQDAVARCRTADLVVVNVRVETPEGCLVYDAKRLTEEGALAIEPVADGLSVVSARDRTGIRPWTQ